MQARDYVKEVLNTSYSLPLSGLILSSCCPVPLQANPLIFLMLVEPMTGDLKAPVCVGVSALHNRS